MQEFDLLVIGGGINGAGVARDAAGRGLSVLLLEKSDLASATSSWSSKLIHGGLRYLEHYEFRLVAEALAEQVLERLQPYFAGMPAAWTDAAPVPGSDFGGAAPEQAFAQLRARYPRLDEAVLRGVFRRHGALAAQVLGDGDLREHYGAGLVEREVRYFVEREWAVSAEDVLWRWSKAGLQMSPAQRERVAQRLGR